MSTLGVIDIGNSAVKIGRFQRKRLCKTHRMFFEGSASSTDSRGILKLLSNVDAVVYSSVNPPAEKKLLGMLREATIPAPLRVRRDIPVPLSIQCRSPHTIGDDRLVNGYEAFHKWGGPVLIVDCGTVNTFDLVSKGGDFLGGAFLPGPELSARALTLGTVLLPQVDIRPVPRRIVGKDTKDAMRSGLYFGFLEGVSGMVERFRKAVRSPLTVVVTGGNAALLKKARFKVDSYSPHLTLYGLSRMATTVR